MSGTLRTGRETGSAVDRAISRIFSEIQDGLRHGYFEYVLTCDIVGQERRRLILKAGKNHQFFIPKEDCERPTSVGDFRNGSTTEIPE